MNQGSSTKVILHYRTFVESGGGAVSLRMPLMQQKWLIVRNPNLFNILCKEMGSIRRALLRVKWSTMVVLRKTLQVITSWRSHLSRPGYLAYIFLKTSAVSLLLQGKWMMSYVVNDKIWIFKQKLEFWKTCISHLVSFTAYQNLKDFSGEIGILTNANFFNLSNETWQHLEDLHNSMKKYSPNDHYAMLQMLEKPYVFTYILYM